jgi:hypothetical protein
MLIRLLPLVTGLLPIITIHLSLLIAIDAGVIEACVPYFDGCTSISATGRYAPASFLFRPVMIAEAVIMIAYWACSVEWLKCLNRSANRDDGSGAAIVVIGSIGAIFLMVYVTFLGTQEPFYEFMRRFGVYLYFAFSIIAQVALAAKLLPVSKLLGNALLTRLARVQLLLALVPFALGILNLVLKAILEDADQEENIIEWIFALLMHVYFVLSYFGWRSTRFSIRSSISLD